MVDRYKPPEAPEKPKTGVVVRFPKGHKKVGGRKVGTPNKTTALLKNAVILAANNIGHPTPVFGEDGKVKKILPGSGELVGYLEFLALYHPTSFATLLGRVLPFQVTGEGGGPVRRINVNMTLQEMTQYYQESLKADYE